MSRSWRFSLPNASALVDAGLMFIVSSIDCFDSCNGRPCRTSFTRWCGMHAARVARQHARYPATIALGDPSKSGVWKIPTLHWQSRAPCALWDTRMRNPLQPFLVRNAHLLTSDVGADTTMRIGAKRNRSARCSVDVHVQRMIKDAFIQIAQRHPQNHVVALAK